MRNFKINQKGIAHIALVLLLLLGIGTSVVLVQKQTNLLPKASNRSDYSKRPVSAPITPKPTRSPSPTGERLIGICHKTDSAKNTYTSISIDKNALDTHLAHGDIYPVPENGCPNTQKTKSPSPQKVF